MAMSPKWWLYGPAAVWTLAALGGGTYTMLDPEGWDAVDLGRTQIATSDRCRRCHAAQYETWHRSYHRTMTQTAESSHLAAPFGGESVEALGFVATMTGGAQGRPHVEVRRLQDGHPAEVVLDADVELTVGSHRYQQYVARIDRGGGDLERWRLPVAWHVGERRWIHLGAAFLLPDGTQGNADDFLRHLSRWNDNCLFCHNTEPSPGLQDGIYRTKVGELGIACEACHGPASAHVARYDQPLRRILSAAGPSGPEGTIVDPSELSPDRSAQVCGRCHGNRIAHDLREILAHGDGFVPGSDLSAVSRPIFADSMLRGDEETAGSFAARFWPDGTPRLSAYEYQALLLSPCHDDGAGMHCGTCHTMHGPEPSMQLRADFDSTGTCIACHAVASLSSGREHGGHASSASTQGCLGCHMPRVTYGLLEGMMSHRVTTPDPGALIEHDDQPDACTQCHVSRSRAWATASLAERSPAGALPREEVSTEAGRVELDLVGGDPIQRALAAHALARPTAVGDADRRRRALVDALEDEYPAVRWFAWRGLRVMSVGDEYATGVLERFDVSSDAAARLELSTALRRHLGSSVVAREPDTLARLQERRDDRAIEIGE